MTLTAREKLAYAVGTMMVAHWNNFHNFNYIETFLSFLDKANPGLSIEEARAMNNELKNYMEEMDYKLEKGMREEITKDKAKQI